MGFATRLRAGGSKIGRPFSAVVVAKGSNFTGFKVIANGALPTLRAFFGAGGNESLCPTFVAVAKGGNDGNVRPIVAS